MNEIKMIILKDIVCKGEEINIDVLNVKTRITEIKQTRQIIHYLARMNNLGTLTEIGEKVGNLNHSTVSHSIKIISDILNNPKNIEFINKINAYKKEFKFIIEEIDRNLKNNIYYTVNISLNDVTTIEDIKTKEINIYKLINGGLQVLANITIAVFSQSELHVRFWLKENGYSEFNLKRL